MRDDPGEHIDDDPHTTQRITQQDLVKGIDFEEDEELDNSRGVRRDRQDDVGEEFVRRSESKDGSAWDGKSGRVV